MTYAETTMIRERFRFQQQDLQPHLDLEHSERISKLCRNDSMFKQFFPVQLTVFDLLPTL